MSMPSTNTTSTVPIGAKQSKSPSSPASTESSPTTPSRSPDGLFRVFSLMSTWSSSPSFQERIWPILLRSIVFWALTPSKHNNLPNNLIWTWTKCGPSLRDSWKKSNKNHQPRKKKARKNKRKKRKMMMRQLLNSFSLKTSQPTTSSNSKSSRKTWRMMMTKKRRNRSSLDNPEINYKSILTC